MNEKMIKLNDRELQLIQHSLEHMAEGFSDLFSVPELKKELKDIEEKVLLTRFPKPKEKKGWVYFRTSSGRWVSFKLRKPQQK